MDTVIASTYRVDRQIGAGGSGTVYLGEHLRLNKPIVLKAVERRKMKKSESLRREVDALKNLSHAHIPQVYDYIEEDNIAYTVMSYVEGQSLDKLLEKGEPIDQVRVIKWAVQLLDALCYLHSRPPHGILHSDIKPANIMLTPNDDVILIDFNIALALGEAGAVRVGRSRGYASPEHYGLDYSGIGSGGKESSIAETSLTDAETTLDDSSNYSTTSSSRSILLDVRSDIYSLGATLYHLLTGSRPKQDAKDVHPMAASDRISQSVADIINRAMQPNPENRYQTAAEMLRDFKRLHINDSRSILLRKKARIAAAALVCAFLLGGVSTFAGLKMQERAAAILSAKSQSLAEISRISESIENNAKISVQNISDAQNAIAHGDTKNAITLTRKTLADNKAFADNTILALSTISDNDGFSDDEIKAAKENALAALSENEQYNAQAQNVLTDALGVYDLSSGFHAVRALELPTTPIKAGMSPNGTRIWAICTWKLLIFDSETGDSLSELDVEPSVLSDVAFLDENHLVYASSNGVCSYDLSGGKELWCGNPATMIATSSDGSKVAAVYKDSKEAYVYQVESGEIVQTISFGGRRQWTPSNDTYMDAANELLALNDNGSWMAASFDNGTLALFDLEHLDEDNTIELMNESDYKHFEGGFRGSEFAFSASGSPTQNSIFAVVNYETPEIVGNLSLPTAIHVQASKDGIYVANNNTLVYLDTESGKQTEAAYTEKDIASFQRAGDYTVVGSVDKSFYFFDRGANELQHTKTDHSCDFVTIAGNKAVIGSRDTTMLRVMALDEHKDAEILSYDPAIRHDEARLSADGKTFMLFWLDKFCILRPDGSLIAEIDIPDASQIHDRQYRRDGEQSYLEITYKDGLIRSYSAQNGELIDERIGEKPDLTLKEEYLTDRFKIIAVPHEAPVVYDRDSGEKLWELELEDELTYVTQVDDNLVTEYVTSQGKRYGLLLNANGETLARLPNLCDILDGKFIFDYPSGNLRATHIYSLEELLSE